MVGCLQAHDPNDAVAPDTAPVMLINSITDRLEEITDRLEEIIFHHVVYHHSFSHNLLSVGRLWQDYRIAVQFDNFKYLQCYSSGGRYRFTYDNGYNYIVPYQHLLRTMVSIPSIGDLGVVAIATFAGWFLAVARNFSNFNGTFEHDPASCDACMAGGALVQQSVKCFRRA